jgi:hypothetical protein
VLIVLPGAMTARNGLSTYVARRLGEQQGLIITVVTADVADESTAAVAGLAWQRRRRLFAGYVMHQAVVFRLTAGGLLGCGAAPAAELGPAQDRHQGWRAGLGLVRAAVPALAPCLRLAGSVTPRSRS